MRQLSPWMASQSAVSQSDCGLQALGPLQVALCMRLGFLATVGGRGSLCAQHSSMPVSLSAHMTPGRRVREGRAAFYLHRHAISEQEILGKKKMSSWLCSHLEY